MLKENWFKLSVILILIIALFFVYNYKKDQDLQKLVSDCSTKGEKYLKSLDESRTDNLVFNGRWNYSKMDQKCYFIEDTIYISPEVQTRSKSIINLDTNERVHQYTLGTGNRLISGGPQDFVDGLEKTILDGK